MEEMKLEVDCYSGRTAAISISCAGKRRRLMGLGIWCRSGNYHARADFSLNSQGVRPAISGSDNQNIWLSVKQLTVSRTRDISNQGLASLISYYLAPRTNRNGSDSIAG